MKQHNQYSDVETDLLVVVGDDAPDKVGVGVVERGHEFAQLFLVQLAHSAEHAFLGARTKCGLVGGRSPQTNNLSCK